MKDIFHVDGLPTGAGSRLPPERLAGPQAAAVTRLLAAGALVGGKTATTEFAYFGPAPTVNPVDPERTPGGSSSGSAAAVAAGLVPAALGTQTIGSISRPASFCGVVGWKPTYGRVPAAGVIPLSPSLDHVGVLAADVAAAARLAAVLAPDWRRPRAPARPVLVIPEGPYLERAAADGRALFAAAVARLEAGGYRVERRRALADFAAIEKRHLAIVAAEAAAVHAAWYAEFAPRYHPKTAELVERGRRVAKGDLDAALAGRDALAAELECGLAAAAADLWISPAAPGVAPRGLTSTGDPVMNLPWTHAGLPTLALPAARDAAGLPFAVQLAAARGGDEELLAWGRELERALADATG